MRNRASTVLSIVLLMPGIISLIINGLEFGIDFTGGSAWEVQYEEAVDVAAIRDVLAEHGRAEAQAQQVGDGDEHRYLIRLHELQHPPAGPQAGTLRTWPTCSPCSAASPRWCAATAPG